MAQIFQNDPAKRAQMDRIKSSKRINLQNDPNMSKWLEMVKTLRDPNDQNCGCQI